MQYEVEIGGRRRQVVVERTGDDFAVTVDGHTRQVDAARIDADTLSLVVDTVSPIEAMKMENELRASRDGTVTGIHAREGMSVDAGALLIVIQ